MTELKGTLLSHDIERQSRPECFYGGIGGTAIKGDLAPDNDTEGVDVVEAEPTFSIINRDSGTTYSLIGRVKKPDGRVTLRFGAADGSGARVTLPESRLSEALETPGGAWQEVDNLAKG